MKVLVTGASGFMGQRLTEKLISLSYTVRILVRDRERMPTALREKCEVVLGDITIPETIFGCCEDIDIVFNLAALMGHDLPSQDAFARFRKVNVEGLMNIVYEAERCNVKRFIHVSSTAAMGLLNENLVDETTPCKPYTPYQVTKYEGEQFLLDEFEKKKFPVIILRPSMVYGPGFKGDFLTLAKVCKTGFFPVIGKGKNLSPALFITDLIEVLPCCVSNGKVGEVYLISSVKSYPLHQVSEIIGRSLNKKIVYVYVPRQLAVIGAFLIERIFVLIKRKPPVTKRNIESTITDRIFVVKKAQKDLHFKQKVSLEKGLTETIQYFLDAKYL